MSNLFKLGDIVVRQLKTGSHYYKQIMDFNNETKIYTVRCLEKLSDGTFEQEPRTSLETRTQPFLE